MSCLKSASTTANGSRRPQQPPKLDNPNRLQSPKVFVSYAWGDISPSASDEDRQRKEVIEQLCRTLEQEYWHVVRDKNALHPGDLISDFMKTLGQARLVIVVLSEKYLRSPFA